MEGFAKFMASPAGIAIFAVVAFAVLVLILALNYRFFAKALLDFLFGVIFVIILSPLFAVCAVIVKRRAGRVLDEEWVVGKGGKPVKVHVFAPFEREGRPGYISRSALMYLPLLFGVLCGRLSIVGPVPLSLADGTLLSEEFEPRFAVRPGIISPAANAYAVRPSYEEMFAADCEYEKRRSLFFDIRAFVAVALRTVRGEKGKFLELGRGGYGAELLADGKITGQQLADAKSLGEQSLGDFMRSSNRVG